MPGMQFEFDEKGGSFYYFLVSFYALVLLPLTYYFWPSEPRETSEINKKKCHCEQCQIKRHILKTSNPGKGYKRKLLKLVFIIAWIAFIFLAYKVSQIEMEWTEFNPFAELGIDRDATPPMIRKAYKQLSLKYHPDKGGDAKRFMRIAKAYAALTNEQSRKNWQEYGNPDGPEAAQFGIALPKWIVEKKNSVWVLGAYALVFMVILPVSVGTWWYRTIKFSGDKVLLDTSHLFFYFFHRTPDMALKRALMILAGAFEYDRIHNSEIVERPSDNEEVPAILKYLPSVNTKNRERPFCAPYSVKARALIHAHLSRLPLPPNTLMLDKEYVVKKCPYLINEMINIVAQLVYLARAKRVPYVPRMETLENCMRLCPMIMQALWNTQSPMLQLPHVTEDMLRHFVTRKRNIKTIKQLVEMQEEERKSLLRSLTDDQYRDLFNVCSNMPYVTMDCHCEVRDEEDPSITTGSLVTVTVRLRRRPMGTLMPAPTAHPTGYPLVAASLPQGPLYSEAGEGAGYTPLAPTAGEEAGLANGKPATGDGEANETESSPKRKAQAPVWEKQRRKGRHPPKGGKGRGKGGKPVQRPPVAQQPTSVETVTATHPVSTAALEDGHDTGGSSDAGADQNAVTTVKEKRKVRENRGRANVDSDDDTDQSETVAAAAADEEEGWKRFQEEARKENSLETKERNTHQVHCPYFPAEKFEGWWLYMTDRKQHLLLTQPTVINSLQTEEEVQLKFTAPFTPGVFVYTVCLRSDCYLDADLTRNIRLVVKEAQLVEDHPQWDLSDDDDEKSGAESGLESDSEGSNTDYDYDD